MAKMLLAVLLLTSGVAALQDTCSPRLDTHTGPVCGNRLGNGAALEFLGVPFAAPPTGNLRWKLPVDPEPWTTPRDATKYGPGCLQLHHNPDVPHPQSEDCLNLNVYMPGEQSGCGTAPLPAMIWVHGGSYEEGGSSLFFYNGTVLATRECVIIVAGNYRLGAFGAVLLDDLPGNQHLHDQRAVMQWAHKNAKALNIDTTRVTVFGQSAGAMSVGFHLTSPNSTGLFSRAIMQSNVAGYPYKSRKEGLQYGKLFRMALDCKDTACMQAKTPEDVMKAWDTVEQKVPDIIDIVLSWRSLDVILPFTPTVAETPEFPLQPLEAFKQGAVHDVPILMGTNEADAVLFIDCGKHNVTKTMWDIGLDVAFGDKAHDISERYPVKNNEQAWAALNAVGTDFLFRCPSRKIAGRSKPRKSPTFLYRFNHSLAFNVYNKSCCNGLPCHGEEVPLVFHATGPYKLDPASEQLSTALMAYWAQFARAGDPNPPNPPAGLPHWPAFDEKGDTIWLQNNLLITPSTGGVCDSLWDTFTPFWDQPAD